MQLYQYQQLRRFLISCTENRTFQRLCSTDISKPLPIYKQKAKMERAVQFEDYKRITAEGGCGGNGMLSFLSAFQKQFAGPHGGDGGNGGHVIFKANSGLRSLSHLGESFIGGTGAAGRSKNQHGANAFHLYVEVPVGTMFKKVIPGQKPLTGPIMCDLRKTGQIFLAARGGAGGHGNNFYLSNENRAPAVAEVGGDGEVVEYELELRIIAHAGLIGFPNAGKSTLLRAISRASPKVASYPFTTLNPFIGMIEYDDYEQVAVADIPGLISGAHKNYGLGISFLRHIERCLCLFYVIDLSLPEPWRQLQELQYELEQYKTGLSKRPHAVIGNKIDLEGSDERLKELQKHVDLPVISISAKYRTGTYELLLHLRKLYDQYKDDWTDEK